MPKATDTATRGVRFHEDIHEEGVVDPALLQKKAQREKTASTVQRHMGRLLLASRPNGQRLELAGGEQRLRQEGDVVVRRFAEPEVLGRDVQIAQMHQRARARGGDLEWRRDDGDGGGTAHGRSPAGGEAHPRYSGARPLPSFPS